MFEVGEIVVIVQHFRPEVVGREAEILIVRPDLAPPIVMYLIIDSTGRKCAALHEWLRRRDWKELQTRLNWRPIERGVWCNVEDLDRG